MKMTKAIGSRKSVKRLFIFCLPLLALQVPLLAQEKSETIEKSFRMDAARPAALEFHDVDGNLYLSPSADNTMAVRIKKEVRSRDGKRAERLLRETKVAIDQHGNTLSIRIKYPRFRGFFFWLTDNQRVKVTSEISVPANTRIKADLVDGSISGDGLQGDLDLEIVDGDIRLSQLRGTIKVNAVDGQINVSGDMKGLELQSVDGDIRVSLSPGSAMAKDWEIRTVDGDVEISLPADFSADLGVQTSDGRIETDFPLDVTKGITKKKLSGKLGGGGFLFSIRTTDGRVSLRKK